MSNFLHIWTMFQNTRCYKFLNKQAPVKLWLALLWGAVAILLGYFSVQFNDTDLYYMIPTGRYILENGIPYTNPFCITEGLPIIIQNWLYCMGIAFIYNHLHTFGLWMVMIVQLLLMYFVLTEFFHIRSSRNKILIGFASAFIMAVFSYLSLRPEIITFVLVMAELLGIEKYRTTGKVRYAWLLPLTVLLEINLHASYWVMHYILLLPYLVPVPKFLKLRNKAMTTAECNKIVLPLLTSAGCLFLNPYGYKNILYVFHSLQSNVFSVVTISEQQAFSIKSLYAAMVLFFLYLLRRAHRNRILDSVSFFMGIGTFILVIDKIKWIAFFAIGFAYVIRCFTSEWEKNNRFNFGEIRIPMCCTVVLAVAYLVIGYAFVDYEPLFFDTKTDEYMLKTNFVSISEEMNSIGDYLDEHDPDARIFARFEHNNYFEFRGYRVFYDARPELYVPEIAGKDLVAIAEKVHTKLDVVAYKNTEDITMQQASLSYEDYDALMKSLPVDYFVLHRSETVPILYLESHPENFDLVHSGEQMVVYHVKG